VLIADGPAASPTAFSGDIVKWGEEKLVSVCFHFIFFSFAAGFLVNRRHVVLSKAEAVLTFYSIPLQDKI